MICHVIHRLFKNSILIDETQAEQHFKIEAAIKKYLLL